MSNADLDKFLGECPTHKKLPWKIGAMESGQVAIDSDDGKEVTGWIDPEDAFLILNQQQCIEELERENNELAARIGKELNEENLALRAEIAELVAALEQCNRYAKATLPTGYLALFTGQALAKVRKP